MDTALVEDKYKYKTFRANSGAIRFRIIVESSSCLALPEIYLIEEQCPHGNLFMITFDYHIGTINIKGHEITTQCIEMPKSLSSLKSTDMWLSWYKNHFRMGLVDNGSFAETFSFPLGKGRPTVGFITFRCSEFINVDIKDPPVTVIDCFKKIEGGEPRWEKILDGYKLPEDAVIGGFQGEVTYVARAEHNGSLCPGQYMSSKLYTYVPWGFAEHEKKDFEILCGYNHMWLNCKSPYLPDNALTGGISEVNNEPLYIARARIQDVLACGKVHMLYKSCYLPYYGSEVSTNIYEVLVHCNSETSESNWKRKCIMVNCAQPCP